MNGRMWTRAASMALALALALGVGLLGLAGCNTMQGAGEDIERAGESVQDAAD